MKYVAFLIDAAVKAFALFVLYIAVLFLHYSNL